MRETKTLHKALIVVGRRLSRASILFALIRKNPDK
jgi:hypothetical protein